MAEKTKADLEQENAELRARVAELLEQTHAPAAPRRPELPSFGMSEGTRNDIEQTQLEVARNPRITKATINEPFTGRPITVTEDTYQIADAPPLPPSDGVASVAEYEH